MSDSKQEIVDRLSEGVIENSKWVNIVLTTAITLAGAIVLLKFTGVDQFEWFDVNFATDQAWFVFILLTIAHIYTSWLLEKSTYSLWRARSPEANKNTFHKIVTTGGVFVRGLVPRTKYKVSKLRLFVYQMRSNDPTTWLVYFLALLFVLAVVPFNFNNFYLVFFFVTIALSLLLVNWVVASRWIVALSELTLDIDKSQFLLDKGKGKIWSKLAFPVTKRFNSKSIPKGYIKVLDGDIHAGEIIEIYGDTSIGRSRQNADIVFQTDFPFSPINRLHCTILDEEGQFTIRDEDSANGTFVNGLKAPPLTPVKLNDGDEIQLGQPEQGGLKLRFSEQL